MGGGFIWPVDGLCLVEDRIIWGISSLGESRRIAVGERQQATPHSPLNPYCDLPSFIPLALLLHIPPSTPQPLLLAASSALPKPIAQLTLIPLEPPPRCLPVTHLLHLSTSRHSSPPWPPRTSSALPTQVPISPPLEVTLPARATSSASITRSARRLEKAHLASSLKVCTYMPSRRGNCTDTVNVGTNLLNSQTVAIKFVSAYFACRSFISHLTP